MPSYPPEGGDRKSKLTVAPIRLVKDILAAGLRHASTIVAGVATVALVARACGPDALGVWAMMATLSLLLALCDLGLTTAVHRSAVTPDHERTRRLVGLSVLVTAALAPLVALVAYVFLLDVPGATPELRADASRAAVLVLAGGVAAAFTVAHRGFVLVRGGMQSLARARAVGAGLQIAITAAGLYVSASLVAPALGLCVGLLVESVLTARAARAIDPELPLTPRRPRSRDELFTALRDGSAALAINIAVAAAVRIDVFILARVAPLAAVAGYGVASRAVDQSFLLAKQASAALLPKLGDPRERSPAAELGTAVLGGLGASGLVALALCGTALLVAWAGPMAATDSARAALGLLAAGAVILSACEVVSSTLTLGARSPWEAAQPIVLGAVVNVAISVAGARSYGVWAVAGGTVVGNLIVAVIVWKRARLLLRWKRARVAQALAPVFAAGAGAFLVGSALTGVASRGPFASLGACAAAMGAGCAAALVTAFVSGSVRTPKRARDARVSVGSVAPGDG